MAHKFLIHGIEDSVGVAVADIKAGEPVVGVYLDSNKEINITANHDIPLGHKIALVDLAVDDFVIEYAEKIGKATQPIKIGDWTHVHNIKSARWGK